MDLDFTAHHNKYMIRKIRECNVKQYQNISANKSALLSVLLNLGYGFSYYAFCFCIQTEKGASSLLRSIDRLHEIVIRSDK